MSQQISHDYFQDSNDAGASNYNTISSTIGSDNEVNTPGYNPSQAHSSSGPTAHPDREGGGFSGRGRGGAPSHISRSSPSGSPRQSTTPPSRPPSDSRPSLNCDNDSMPALASPQQTPVLEPMNSKHDTSECSPGSNGLINDGNSCFMNAALQIFNILPIAEIIHNCHRGPVANYLEAASEDLKTITREVRNILRTLRGPSVEKGCPTKTFYSNLRLIANKSFQRFPENVQGDAGEFLGWLLEALKIGPPGMHEFPKNLVCQNGFDILEHAAKDIQVGITTTGTCIAPGCDSSTHNTELSNQLIISYDDGESGTNLEAMLEQAFGDADSRMVNCRENLEHTWAKSSERLTHVPNHLIIQYKRTIHTITADGNDSIVKNMNQVPTQERLDLWNFLHDEAKAMYEREGRSEDTTLDLIGLIRHNGQNGDSGHYVAIIKGADGEWREFDDHKVTVTIDPWYSVESNSTDYVLVYGRTTTGWPLYVPMALMPALNKELACSDADYIKAIHAFMAEHGSEATSIEVATIQKFLSEKFPNNRQDSIGIFHDMCTPTFRFRKDWLAGGAKHVRFLDGPPSPSDDLEESTTPTAGAGVVEEKMDVPEDEIHAVEETSDAQESKELVVSQQTLIQAAPKRGGVKVSVRFEMNLKSNSAAQKNDADAGADQKVQEPTTGLREEHKLERVKRDGGDREEHKYWAGLALGVLQDERKEERKFWLKMFGKDAM